MPFRFSTLLIVSLIVIMCFSLPLLFVMAAPDSTGGAGSGGTGDTTGGAGSGGTSTGDDSDSGAGSGGTTVWILNPLKIDTVQGLIDLVLNWLLMIAIPLSTIVILYGAMLFMIYGSVPAKRKKARDVILYAVIGIVILLLAKGISYSIMSFLTP